MKDANTRLVYDEGLSGGRAESPGVQLLLPCRVDGLLATVAPSVRSTGVAWKQL